MLPICVTSEDITRTNNSTSCLCANGHMALVVCNCRRRARRRPARCARQVVWVVGGWADGRESKLGGVLCLLSAYSAHVPRDVPSCHRPEHPPA